MISPITVSKFYSVLGNNDSLVPMAIKDTANGLGLTAGSYITGKDAESQDRFIDEFGSQAIWLFGIPVFKKVLDWSLFKPLGLDPGVDVRVLKDKDVFELAKKYAKQHDEQFKDNLDVKKIAQSLEKITDKQKTFKGLSFAKFVGSTLLTIISYGMLTEFRQKYREQKITKEFYEKEAKKTKTLKSLSIKTPSAFKKVKSDKKDKNNKNTTFTGGFNIQDFMFSPVKNLMIVDGSITAERLAKSQNKQEFFNYTIKEGFFWFFMYFAGARIKKMLENHALKKHNIPIDLDARVIESMALKKAVLGKDIMRNVYQFPVGNPTPAEIYEFVNTNPDNLIVQMAKKCDIARTVKGTNSIDNRKFIDPEEVVALKDKLILLNNKGEEYVKAAAAKAKKAAETAGKQYEFTPKEEVKFLKEYLKKASKLNRSATLKNIAACIGFLGVLLPGMMVAWRFMDKDNKNYQVREEIEKKLRTQMAQNKPKQTVVP